MLEIRLEGNTYSIKDELKAEGYRWNPQLKAWTKRLEDSERERANSLAEAYEANGVYGCVKQLADPNERKYMVKEDWIFNLESMHDKLFVIEQDVREGKLQLGTFEIAGKAINSYEDLDDLADEAAKLCWIAKSRKVTGKEYGRIRKIITWRVMARYAACMASGMDERKAATCFEEL